MLVYIAAGVALLLATVVVHWLVWKYFVTPRLQKFEKELKEKELREQQALSVSNEEKENK